MTCVYYGGPNDGAVISVPNNMKTGEFYEDVRPEGTELYFLKMHEDDGNCRRELVFQGYRDDVDH